MQNRANFIREHMDKNMSCLSFSFRIPGGVARNPEVTTNSP